MPTTHIANYPTFISESTDLDESVLYAPARIEENQPCSSLKIITAFTDCERISTHMINLQEGMKYNRLIKGLNVDIILGMTKSSLSKKKHDDICRLINYINGTHGMPRLSCYYICSGPEVHSKIYIWGSLSNNEETPLRAYCGSLNYTTNAFYKRRESVTLCDPVSAYNYYNVLKSDSIDCLNPLAATQLKNITNNTANEVDGPDNSEEEYNQHNNMRPDDVIKISLLLADGSDTGYGSGINWGIRRNGTRRDPNQAYIPYNRQDKREGFFPDRLNPDDPNCPMFKVVTKDFGAFHMRMAQAGNKALHSVESNAILGEWIRNRIKAASGGYITKKMLDNYGKTYVTFRKYSDGIYLLDF